MIIGQFYQVPAVRVSEWWGFEGWIPVVGPMHEDAEFVNFPHQLLHIIGGTEATGERQGSRELSLAQTKIEEAVMWAVKHITR